MKLVSLLVVSASVRLYGWLILLYPVSFRLEYGEEMIQLFRDLCWDEMKQGRGLLGLLKLWSRILAELQVTTKQQHLLAGSYYRRQRNFRRSILAIISAFFLFGGWLFWLNGGAQFFE
jgi:hypothetical protein